MRKICIYGFGALLCLFYGCCGREERNRLSPVNTVTIIFKDAPDQSSTQRLGGGLFTMPEATVMYIDSALNKRYYVPRNIGYDTLTIWAPFGYAEILHRNQVIENNSFLLEAGDTVLFTYGENLRPQIRSMRSERNTWLYNLPFTDVRAVTPVGYSTGTILKDLYYRLAEKALKHPKKKLAPETLSKYESFHIDLDSLRPIWKSYQKDMMNLFDSLEANKTLPAIYANYYRQQISDDITNTPGSILSDSLMHFISYYNKAVNLQYLHSPKEAKSPQRFDLIAADTSLTPAVRKAILSDILSLIENGDYWRPYPKEVVERYRERYRELTGDSISFVSVTLTKENLLPEGYSSDLLLLGMDGEQTALETLLQKYKGKVIYVDLWASWCGPCRGRMPAAKKLRELYRGKDVVFLYLAINDTEKNWKNAVRSCETDYLGENYFILNGQDSRFLREIKHTKIPHMLLYDRTGALVDADAPRPETEEVRALLNEYLR